MNQFTRTELIFGKGAMEKLYRAHVAVFGLGGLQLLAKVVILPGELVNLGVMAGIDVFQILDHVVPVKAVERGAEILRFGHRKALLGG